MTSFKEYVKSNMPSFRTWGDRFVISVIGVICLSVTAMCLGLANHWFYFLFAGLPPLIMYANYCDSREWED